nr:hypothetical protein [Rhodococcus rhodochrous]
MLVGPDLRAQYGGPQTTRLAKQRGGNEIRYRVALRVAWTLSDLDGSDSPSATHVAAALDFRDRGVA